MTEALLGDLVHRLELLEATAEAQRVALGLHDDRLERHTQMLATLATMGNDIREFMTEVRAILGDAKGGKRVGS